MVTRGLYEHFKGNVYHVMAVAKHTETGERLVIYRHVLKSVNGTPCDNIWADDIIWARPESMFEEILENGQPRFRRL